MAVRAQYRCGTPFGRGGYLFSCHAGRDEHNQEILQYNEQLNQKNEEISSLNNSIETYKSDKDSAEEQLNNFLNSNESVVNQYSILVKILQAYRNNNLTEAVSLYAGFNPALFTDEKDLAIANAVKQDIDTRLWRTWLIRCGPQED